MLDGRLFNPTGVPQAVANPLVAAMPARTRLRVERSAVSTVPDSAARSIGLSGAILGGGSD